MYYPDNPKDNPKTPSVIVNKTDEETENLVVGIRKNLEKTKYSQIGANAIRF